MTPFVADTASHRSRLAWLAAALAASTAAFVATRTPAPSSSEVYGSPYPLGIGRCAEFRRAHAPGATTDDGRLPSACVAYQVRLWRMSECDQLPPSGRRALREAWEQTTTSWSQLSPEARLHLSDGCRTGSAALDEAAAAMHCTYNAGDRILIADDFEQPAVPIEPPPTAR